MRNFLQFLPIRGILALRDSRDSSGIYGSSNLTIYAQIFRAKQHLNASRDSWGVFYSLEFRNACVRCRFFFFRKRSKEKEFKACRDKISKQIRKLIGKSPPSHWIQIKPLTYISHLIALICSTFFIWSEIREKPQASFLPQRLFWSTKIWNRAGSRFRRGSYRIFWQITRMNCISRPRGESNHASSKFRDENFRLFHLSTTTRPRS